jgi:uncharacterized membrane protein YdjX (TVP38/TMEM64 family)
VELWVYALGTVIGLFPSLVMDVVLGSLLSDISEVSGRLRYARDVIVVREASQFPSLLAYFA